MSRHASQRSSGEEARGRTTGLSSVVCGGRARFRFGGNSPVQASLFELRAVRGLPAGFGVRCRFSGTVMENAPQLKLSPNASSSPSSAGRCPGSKAPEIPAPMTATRARRATTFRSTVEAMVNERTPRTRWRSRGQFGMDRRVACLDRSAQLLPLFRRLMGDLLGSSEHTEKQDLPSRTGRLNQPRPRP